MRANKNNGSRFKMPPGATAPRRSSPPTARPPAGPPAASPATPHRSGGRHRVLELVVREHRPHAQHDPPVGDLIGRHEQLDVAHALLQHLPVFVSVSTSATIVDFCSSCSMPTSAPSAATAMYLMYSASSSLIASPRSCVSEMSSIRWMISSRLCSRASDCSSSTSIADRPLARHPRQREHPRVELRPRLHEAGRRGSGGIGIAVATACTAAWRRGSCHAEAPPMTPARPRACDPATLVRMKFG
jgi:hypothetical protein